MDDAYAQTVRLLLTVVPDVFAGDLFAMKGGTAINLFLQDMPRLSVDIDVVYLPWQVPRDEALAGIGRELGAIAAHVERLGLQTRLVRSKDSDAMVECFVVYLAGRNRPTHEVLFGNDKDIAAEYQRAFQGMADVDCDLPTLIDVRSRLRDELPRRLSAAHRQFLGGLAWAASDWSLR